MKIGIVTFVKADNYGAELQAYALQKKINGLGHDAEVLDLEKEEGVMSSSYRTIVTAFKKRLSYYGVFRGWGECLKLVFETLKEKKNVRRNYKRVIEKHKIFETFFYSRIKHSVNHIKMCDIDKVELPYDVYIAGSDQIWNYMQTNRLDVFFLLFANKFKAKKISYAASFSVPDIPEELRPIYKSYLNNLDAISVRESNALKIISKCSPDLKACQVLDPTLLLTKTEWIKDLAIDDYLPIIRKYVVIYTLSGSKYIFDLACKVAREINASVIHIKSDFSEIKPNDEIIHIEDAGPQEFITIFSKADYVITDSFHGTAFSINFNIPFTTLLNPVSNMNSRAISILELTDLTNRIIYDDGKRTMPSDLTVNFEAANCIIERMRKYSTDFLRENLKCC